MSFCEFMIRKKYNNIIKSINFGKLDILKNLAII